MRQGHKPQILGAIMLSITMTSLCDSVAVADAVTNPQSRILITVDAHAQTELLAEMRALLANLQRLLEALSNSDLKSVARAARASGIQSAAESADDLSERLPRGFFALGMSMHQDFDRIADMVASGGDGHQVLNKVAVTMRKCVACHTAYQLHVGKAGPAGDKQYPRSGLNEKNRR